MLGQYAKKFQTCKALSLLDCSFSASLIRGLKVPVPSRISGASEGSALLQFDYRYTMYMSPTTEHIFTCDISPMK